MIRICIAIFFLFIQNTVFTQNIQLSKKSDSLFPVTNKFNQAYDFQTHIVYRTSASVFNITSDRGKYYFFGDFTNLAINNGREVILDTGTHNIKTSENWKVNGPVYTAIPDDNGGFYIGGSFSKIGVLNRRNLAHIDSSGKPTTWNPNVKGNVLSLFKRNDTLFFSGDFTYVNKKRRYCFAMYSLKDDSVFAGPGAGSYFTYMNSINSFLIEKDTLIFAGDSRLYPILKYNFKDKVFVNWQLQFSESQKLSSVVFNKDHTVLLYTADEGRDRKSVV